MYLFMEEINRCSYRPDHVMCLYNMIPLCVWAHIGEEQLNIEVLRSY